MKKVDARGYSCPQPVMMARQAVQAGEFPIEVLVDTVTSRENVRRATQAMGFKVEVQEYEDGFSLTIDREK
jgi:TusA-related sulfurtransferase